MWQEQQHNYTHAQPWTEIHLFRMCDVWAFACVSVYLCSSLWPWYTLPPVACTVQYRAFSAWGESGTSEAVISVMCFSTWMDGGKNRSMGGWVCSMVTVWLLWPCDMLYYYWLLGDGHTSGRTCALKQARTYTRAHPYQSRLLAGWPPQAGGIQQ